MSTRSLAPVRVLALDYGRSRCGCAVSDPTGVLARPLEPVPQPRSRRGLRRLRALVGELGAGRVVVGLPLRLGGGDSEQTRETREFARQLRRVLPVPVELYDERFTTVLARRAGGRAAEDSRAAAHLLEAWLAHAAMAERERSAAEGEHSAAERERSAAERRSTARPGGGDG